MKLLKNTGLRRKMVVAFLIIILIMCIALATGMFGLNKSIKSLKQLRNMSTESELGSRIESELHRSGNILEQFLNNSDQTLIQEFNKNVYNMEAYLQEMQLADQDREIKQTTNTLKVKVFDYKGAFEALTRLDQRRLSYYDTLSREGGIIVDAIESLDQQGQNDLDYNAQIDLGKASSFLLQARLHAMKFFTFHEEEEYQAYLKDYETFKSYVGRVDYLGEQVTSQSIYKDLITSIDVYQSGMAELKMIIDSSDYQVLLIGQAREEIIECIDGLKGIIENKQVALEEELTRETYIIMVLAGILALVTLFVTFIMSSWLMRIVTVPIEHLKNTFMAISEGNVDLDFRLNDSSKDEIGQMSTAFNKFMSKLKDMMKEIYHQNWVKTAQNELNKESNKSDNLKELSDNILTYLCHFGDIGHGIMYVYEDDLLKPTAMYGINEDLESIKIGQGLVGQTAKDQKTLHLTNVPDDYYQIATGTGSHHPNAILLVACVYEGEVKAVLELAKINDYDSQFIELIKALSDAIAVSIHSSIMQSKMKALLDRTLHQSEELQMQQEELRQSNEELEEQTRALKDSEQRLQAQQEELRVSNEELEQRAHQLETQKKALDESNKQMLTKQQEIVEKAEALELANTYKSEFLANMSHELRTPLNSILVLSQLLAERESNTPLTSKEREFADTIYSSGNDLLTLINDVLDLSKVEAGHLDILFEEFELTKLLRDSEKMFKPLTDSKAIEFQTKLDPSLPSRIKTDYLRVQQIIKNLVSNSIKFTEKGHVELHLRQPTPFELDTVGGKVNHYVAMEVTDTGIGIPEEKKMLIFEAFRQSDGTTSRKYGGTGLGLTISRELSSLLKGEILVESVVGKGSKFVLLLPMNVTIEEPVAQPVEQDQEIYEDFLLIIEDDKSFSKILSDLASEKGFKTQAAYTGASGLAMAKDHKPEAIILDLGLPDIDGEDLVNELSKLGIPIHIISGSETKGDLPTSVIGYLKKPVDIKSIYKTLAKIEALSTNDQKKLLVIGDCNGEEFKQFENLGQMSVTKVSTFDQAFDHIQSKDFECLVLDYGLNLSSDQLDLVKDQPIIIYSDHELSNDELDSITKYTDNIILKSPKSEERLIDEVTLFLHGMKSLIDNTQNASEQYKTVILDEMSDKVKADDYFSGKRVLIVDDDDRNVFALSNVLAKHGFDIEIAQDGYESINKAEKTVYDIILMDIMMPKMDGYDAIKGIRKLHDHKDTPIIALTAKAMKEDRIKCIEAGANDYLTKPIDIEKLLSMMKVWLA